MNIITQDILYKQGIVKYSLKFRVTKAATALASEYGIDRRLIYRWRNLYKEIAVEDGKTVTNAEYLKMQKQLKELEKENEI